MKISEKKAYQRPRVKTMDVASEQVLAISNVVSSDESNNDTGIGYGGGGSGPAYAREHSVWDE